MNAWTKSILAVFSIFIIALVSGCGGGGDGGSATPTYSISGTVTSSGVAQSGVMITLTGGVTSTTDTNGNYSFTGLANGSYTVTPSRTGYAFSPANQAVSLSGANVTGTNFTATVAATTYSISGSVSGASGVTITLSGANTSSVVTGADGAYTISGLVPGSYTVTPSMTGYTFSPVSAAANVSVANITGTNFVATAIQATYTQADLAGTWNIQVLKAGSSSGWMRATGTVDSSGYMTISSFLDSTGGTSLPAANSMRWTIDSSGVISGSGVNEADQVHMTMTSNKNFIAGTGSDSGGQQLRIIQKMVPGTVYSNADIQNKSFVFHELTVGSQHKWSYGTAATDATGQMTIPSSTDINGTNPPESGQGTLSVDGNGMVTLAGDSTFQGFLSNDKKTIVATHTNSSTRYRMIIFQLTGQTFTAGPMPAGTSVAHMLAAGASFTPFWLHETITVASGGGMTFSDWVASNPAVTAPTTTLTGSISASGTVTVAENPSFHGQMSYDGKFTVGTQTNDTGVYSLQVTTK